MPALMTSGPMPSPGMDAILYDGRARVVGGLAAAVPLLSVFFEAIGCVGDVLC